MRMPEQEAAEQKALHDLSHTLKLMPGNNREMFAMEVARYVIKEVERLSRSQVLEVRLEEVERMPHEAKPELHVFAGLAMAKCSCYRGNRQTQLKEME